MENNKLTEEQVEKIDFEMQYKVFEYCKQMFENANPNGFDKESSKEAIMETFEYFVEKAFERL